MIGHLIGFVLFSVIFGLVRLVSGHGLAIVPSLVLAVPCEVTGVIAGHRLKAWMGG